MTAIRHHIPDPILRAYSAGNLPYHSALVVACHAALSLDARAALIGHDIAGGAVMDNLTGVEMSPGARAAILARLDDPIKETPPAASTDIFPAPLCAAMGRTIPKWRPMGMGSRQHILHHDGEGSVRLLYIPAGQAVPDHGHSGLEMTLVLQGAFADETGRYGVGDVQVANEDLDHTPIAEHGEDCICLASTDGKLRFHNVLLRMLQPLFKI